MTGINLTQGPLLPQMMAFAIPYLLACFLQTFYGMADLFITGLFNGAAPITAVSIGSQLMHMLTVIIVGLAMGTTVSISARWAVEIRRKPPAASETRCCSLPSSASSAPCSFSLRSSLSSLG